MKKSVVNSKLMSIAKSTGVKITESDTVAIERCKHIPEVVNGAKDIAIKGIETMDEGTKAVKDISKDVLETYKDCTDAALAEANKDCYSLAEKKEFFNIAADFADRGAEQGEKSQDRLLHILSKVENIVGLFCIPVVAYVGGKYIVYPFFTKNK